MNQVVDASGLEPQKEPKTPTMLAKTLNLNLANVRRMLSELGRTGLVVCLTPKKRVGKLYALTKRGKAVHDKAEAVR